MASERKKSSSKSRSSKRVTGHVVATRAKRSSKAPAAAQIPGQHYVVCVRNDDYPASLELRKLYPVLEDQFAARHGMIRVVDESGEDYLYPEEFFVRVELPASIEKAIAKIA